MKKIGSYSSSGHLKRSGTFFKDASDLIGALMGSIFTHFPSFSAFSGFEIISFSRSPFTSSLSFSSSIPSVSTLSYINVASQLSTSELFLLACFSVAFPSFASCSMISGNSSSFTSGSNYSSFEFWRGHA